MKSTIHHTDCGGVFYLERHALELKKYEMASGQYPPGGQKVVLFQWWLEAAFGPKRWAGAGGQDCAIPVAPAVQMAWGQAC